MVAHETRIKFRRNTYEVSVEKPDGKDNSKDPKVGGENIKTYESSDTILVFIHLVFMEINQISLFDYDLKCDPSLVVITLSILLQT